MNQSKEDSVTSVFFSDLKPKRNLAQVYEAIVMFNKLIIVLVLMISRYPLFQMFTIVFLQLFHLSYALHVRPYVEKMKNNLEIFDQLTIFMIVYPYLILTNPSIEAEMKNDCGWFVIFVISLNVVTNISVSCYR